MKNGLYSKRFIYFSEDRPLEFHTDSKEILEEIHEKLDPFIEDVETSLHPYVSITSLLKTAHQSYLGLAEKGYEIVIDTSLYKDQASNGSRYDINGSEYIIHIEKTKSLLYFNKREAFIEIYNEQADLLIKDSLRLIKSIISLKCEQDGALMIHSSGMVLEKGGAVLLMGDSRNGKTTILLELLSKFYGKMLSCDTSIIKTGNNSLPVRGWPSNFSVSFGTMHDFYGLHPFLTAEKRSISYSEAWDIHDKHVLDTKEVLRRLGRLICAQSTVNSFICLNFDISSKTCIYRLEDRREIISWIEKVYLGSRDYLYPNWHQFLQVSDEQITNNIEQVVNMILTNNIEVYQMNWAPGPETLLRRVSSLEKYNMNMKLCRDGIQF